MREQINFEGTVENIIYYNAENGFTVFSLAPKDDESKEITCTGTLPQLIEGERVKIKGVFVNNPRYGSQLSVEYVEKNEPTGTDAILRYLGSGVIKGVGERTAKRIVKTFGEDTLRLIDESPERLSEIKGISLEKALDIGGIYHEQAELRRAMLYLQDFGITPAYAMRIYKRFGEATRDIVKTNPYALADDIHGIGFKTADAIAFRAGISLDSPFRLKAGLKYALNQAALNGHVYLPKRQLIDNATELLNISAELIDNTLIQLVMDASLFLEDVPLEDKENQPVYTNVFWQAENYIAQKLAELSKNTLNMDKADRVDSRDLLWENTDIYGIKLAENQRLAVEEALISGVLVLTGGPGTGKTTTINAIIQSMNKYGLRIELAAPTGRAAKRMSETSGIEAKTIHRLLEIDYMSDDSKRQSFSRNENNPIEADVIIIDESSMVDLMLMFHLLKAIAPGARLILAGDVDQLPSVGPGNILADIIQSGAVNVVKLTEIFRQAQESAIVLNAHRINHGEYPAVNDKSKDFFLLKRSTPDEVVNTILDLVMRRLPGFIKDCDNFQDIQVLSPMRKSSLGVVNLNRELQRRMNPASPEKKEREFRGITFRQGDKVMQTKNNYNMIWYVSNANGRKIDEGVGVFNGDMGIMTDINNDDSRFTVRFDDGRIVEYDVTQMEDLELCYAATIHKSQGSEYKAVIIPIHSGPPMLMSRNLLYTAVTRAKELVVIVGSEEMLRRMVDNNREVNRYTALARRLTAK
ncbi:MAG: ATP-dependent RecD-like DNA helicase [Clostridiales bacterium]|jgi:exodeoxyribonuclease V alpha subunit|nr:ATP-dependent RecD-like DNA helicase [Clostridiales bacterium]